MTAPSSRVYHLGDVDVNLARACLVRLGQELHLRQKTFQVLVYLLEQRHRVVSKEEVVETLWKDTAVTDDALVHCIVELRRVLGDDPRQPRFIKTVSKSGYRFVGAVVESMVTSAPHDVPVRIEEETSIHMEVEEEISISHEDAAMSGALPAAPASGRFSWVGSGPALVLLVAAFVAASVYVRQADRGLATADVTLAPEPGRKALVVLPFSNRSSSPELAWLREGVADMLITGLTRPKGLMVLSRQQLSVLLQRQGRRSEDEIELEGALDIARRSRADAFVLGSIAKVGERIRVDAQIHEAGTGRLVAAESVTVDRAAAILREIDVLSLKVAARLGVSAGPQPDAPRLGELMTDNLEAYRCYSLAVERAHALQNTEALALLEKAIALDPQFAMAHARVGYVYAVTWNLAEKAAPYLETAFRLSPRLADRDKLYIAAWYAIAKQEYAGAIRTLRQIAAAYPMEVEALFDLGRLLRGEERLEEAVEALNQGLALDRGSADINDALAGIHTELGKASEALAAAERQIVLTPGEPRAYTSLGLVHQWFGRYEQAFDAYSRAIALDATFEVALVRLGNVYFQTGRYQQALQQYHRYIDIAPSDLERSRGFGRISAVHAAMGDLARAADAARRELRFEPTAVWSSLVIALARGDQARVERLQVEFARFPYTSRGARTSPRYLSYFLGYIALHTNRTDEALMHFGQAVKHRPPIWAMDTYEDCLALIYLRLGRFDGAIAELERILNFNPRYPLAHFHLAQALESKGQLGPAQKTYEQFLQVWRDADENIPAVQNARKKLRTFRNTAP